MLLRQIAITFFSFAGIWLFSSFQTLHSQPGNFLKLPQFADVLSVPWKDSIYRFPEFQKGKITYNTGQLDHEFDLNYNLYFEKIDFISSSGDTLSITNTREIKTIQIGHAWFIHDYTKGFFELILDLPVSLAVKKQFVFRNSKVRGAVHFADLRGVVGNHDRFYEIVPRYVFVDKNGGVHRPTRGTILKLFSDHSEKVTSYLRNHRPDFESREDLVSLLNYCNPLLSF